MTALPKEYELGRTLPGLFQADDVIQGLCAAIDHGLTPIVCALDSMPAYFDPETTQEDMVEWLAAWVGLDMNSGPMPRDRRRFIKRAVGLHAQRGTVAGITAGVSMWFGTTPEVSESGGMGWSQEPDTPLPGSPTPSLVVTLRVSDPSVVDRRLLDAVVSALKPAHVPHRVDVQRVAGR